MRDPRKTRDRDLRPAGDNASAVVWSGITRPPVVEAMCTVRPCELPVVIVALVIAGYRAIVLWMNRSRPADWTWPSAEINYPIRLNKRQFQIASVASIVVLLLVAAWALLRFT